MRTFTNVSVAPRELETSDPLLHVVWQFAQRSAPAVDGAVQLAYPACIATAPAWTSRSDRILCTRRRSNNIERHRPFRAVAIHVHAERMCYRKLPPRRECIRHRAGEDVDRNRQRLIMQHLVNAEHLALTGSPDHRYERITADGPGQEPEAQWKAAISPPPNV